MHIVVNHLVANHRTCSLSNRFLRGLLWSALLALSACSTRAIDDQRVTPCPPLAEYQSFRIEYREVPGFLREYLRLAVNDAFLNAGLFDQGVRVTEEQPAMIIEIAFDQIDEANKTVHADDFEGHLEPGGERAFTAMLDIWLRKPDGETICRAKLSRYHHVSPGDYMHEGRAVAALAEALDHALEL